MTEDQKAQATKIRDEMKAALDKNDIETLKAKVDELEKAAAYAQQYASQAQQQQASASTDTSSAPKDDNVVDADFTEKK